MQADPQNPSNTTPLTILLGSVIGILILIVAFIQEFHFFNEPERWSDVIPQLSTQYERWLHGENPYAPVQIEGMYHTPFPVYLPLHWLPIGIARWLHTDIRVFGIISLGVAIWVGALAIMKKNKTSFPLMISLVLPVLFLAPFFLSRELIYVFETPVAIYYLVAAIALALDALPLMALGLIGALLSRYTIVFWLPLLAVIMWQVKTPKQWWLFWFFISIGICGFYVFPFLMTNPDSLIEGLKYHSATTVVGWENNSDTVTSGFYFAPHLRAILPGTMDHKILLSRLIQMLLMVASVIGGIVFFRKKNLQPFWQQYSLWMMYLILLLFYIIGPNNFRYYLLSFYMVEYVMVSLAWINMERHRNQ
ncbi:MAG: hypothetical protein U0T84_10760 [Chitinophagales bacterium]